MSLANLLVRDITILSPGTRVDGYGDTKDTWDAPTTRRVQGWLAQTSTTENRDGRESTTTSFSLTLPAGTAITAVDRVVVDRCTYEVVGFPTSAWTPRGQHHVEVLLEQVIG